jgi:methanogenic corrinoid protein MtbC1
MATNGKTPYEIRLELLQMAQSHLQSQFDRQMAFATEAMKLATDAQWKSIDELKKLMPQAFTFQDIVAKAQELYGFVQKKD